MAALIRNRNGSPITLPSPYRGIVPAGAALIISDDVDTVIANLGGVKLCLAANIEVAYVPNADPASSYDDPTATKGLRLFQVSAPAAPSTTNVHAAYAGAAKAELDLGTLAAGDLDTVVRAKTAGAAGNLITVSLIGDSPGAGGVTLTESGTGLTIHFEDGVSTVADVETALAGSTLVEVKTTGTGATVLDVPTDEFTATALAGGVAGLTLPGPFTNPDVPRNVRAAFGASWDGGDLTIVGTDMDGDFQAETLADNPGSTVVGTKIFATVTSAAVEVDGVLADTVSIGVGSKLGLEGASGTLGSFAVLFADDVGEAVTLDAAGPAFTPTTAPNGAVVYKLLVNVS